MDDRQYYEMVLEDHRALVRELDVIINGEEGAAEQASLCDIVAQCKKIFKHVEDDAFLEIARKIFPPVVLRAVDWHDVVVFARAVRNL